MDDWRRRKRGRYRDAFKREVVGATLVPGATVAEVARERGLNANPVFNWRRDPRFNPTIGAGDTVAVQDPTSFLPVEVTSALTPAVNGAPPLPSTSGRLGTIRLSLPGGAELRIDGCSDAAGLAQLLRGLTS